MSFQPTEQFPTEESYWVDVWKRAYPDEPLPVWLRPLRPAMPEDIIAIWRAYTARARLNDAAPDLLAACKMALNDRMFKDWPAVAMALMAAIAKAEGTTGD